MVNISSDLIAEHKREITELKARKMFLINVLIDARFLGGNVLLYRAFTGTIQELKDIRARIVNASLNIQHLKGI